MGNDDDWDLYAVVRSCLCSSATSSSSTTVTDPVIKPTTSKNRDNYNITQHSQILQPQLLYTTNSNINNSSSNYNPLVPISPLSVLSGLHDVSPPLQLPVKRQPVGEVSNAVFMPSPRSKRRKIQKKMVCQVAAEDLSSDTWSWRKYGQKPIKGSPYPRGYYKCSTSKGCLARKQVERNRSDPGMFIVTYTAEHNHPMPANRSSLSGISRLKPDGPTTTTEEKKDEDDEKEDFPEADEENDEFVGSDMAVGDDFFEGLEEFTGSGDGDCLLDRYPENRQQVLLAREAELSQKSC